MKQSSAVLKPSPHLQTMNNGLSETYRKDMAGDLSAILSSTYQLTIKSHICHWNVVGPLFKPIHELTEEHYTALFAATDIIAERIRALGHLAPVSKASTPDFAPSGADVDFGSAQSMIEDLVATHEEAVRAMRDAAGKAGEAGDVVTEDMLTERLGFHEKALWMLRATIAT